MADFLKYKLFRYYWGSSIGAIRFKWHILIVKMIKKINFHQPIFNNWWVFLFYLLHLWVLFSRHQYSRNPWWSDADPVSELHLHLQVRLVRWLRSSSQRHYGPTGCQATQCRAWRPGSTHLLVSQHTFILSLKWPPHKTKKMLLFHTCRLL